MNTIVGDTGTVRMPITAATLEGFRNWIHSDGVPEETRAYYLDGEIWVDMSKEQLFSHNQIKGELNLTLGGLVKSRKIGRYLPDGMLFSNTVANLSAQPDGAFFSYESQRAGRVILLDGARQGVVELEGALDMVVEVVSDSSVAKDTKILPELYFRAGIREYWLVDARGETVDFQIFRRGSDSFFAKESVDGWVESEVFGCYFQFTLQADPLGQPEVTLVAKDV